MDTSFTLSSISSHYQSQGDDSSLDISALVSNASENSFESQIILANQIKQYANEILQFEVQNGLFEKTYDLFMKLFVAYKKKGIPGLSKVIISEINLKIQDIYKSLKELFQCLTKREGQALSAACFDVIDEEVLVFNLSPAQKEEIKTKVKDILFSIGIVVSGVGILVLINPAMKTLILETISQTAGALTLGSAGVAIAGGALLLAGGFLLYKWYKSKK